MLSAAAAAAAAAATAAAVAAAAAAAVAAASPPLVWRTTLQLVISAAGKNFCAGLDLSYLSDTFGSKMQPPSSSSSSGSCPARMRYAFRQDILQMQEAFTVLEQSRFPVIAAVQGACVGAGVDLITAADLRYCSQDAYFSVKEVDLAITADLGTLQRLPSIIGHGAAAELALTARALPAAEAATLGLVSRAYSSTAELMEAVMKLAAQIAAKSPLAVAGTKAVLLHTRDHGAAGGGVAGGLAHVALWNSAFLLSGDMQELLAARQARRQPLFSKL
uniref:Enoyl-CoA hydratase n=1 Tax=Tetradesmus obliquus TaxID=3088 RepID=A0A383VWV4_TETOB|eukprot:jgi/Sobl393_1/6918/SZX69339.1